MRIKTFALVVTGSALLFATTAVAQREESATKVLVEVASQSSTKGSAVHSYYDSVSENMASYSVPQFAKIKQVTLHENNNSMQLTVEMQAPMRAHGNDRFIVEGIFLSPTPEGPRTDSRVVYTRGYNYGSQPPLQPRKGGESAGVMRREKKDKKYFYPLTGNVAASVVGPTLKMNFSRSAIGNSAKLNVVIVRYIPGNVDYKRVSGGMIAGLVDTLFPESERPNGQYSLPGPL